MLPWTNMWNFIETRLSELDLLNATNEHYETLQEVWASSLHGVEKQSDNKKYGSSNNQANQAITIKSWTKFIVWQDAGASKFYSLYRCIK